MEAGSNESSASIFMGGARKVMSGKLFGDKNPSKRLEVRKKISNSLKGRTISPEARTKMSENHADVSGENNPHWKGGLIRKSCKECHKEFQVRRWREHTAEFCSSSCKSKFNSQGERNGNWRGGPVSRVCQECGKTFQAMLWVVRWGGGKFCSRSCSSKYTLKYSDMHRNRRPTKPEIKLIGLIEKYDLPYKYTGDNTFKIGTLNPDFVNCNGHKIAVEVFGNYWHTPKLGRNVSYNQTLEGRTAIMKDYGWKLIILWERELNALSDEEIVARLK